MSKTHCDWCDKVIPANHERLVLQYGVGKGNAFWGLNSDHEMEACATCIAANKPLKKIWEQAKKEGLR